MLDFKFVWLQDPINKQISAVNSSVLPIYNMCYSIAKHFLWKKNFAKNYTQIIDEIEDEQVLYILKEDLAKYATITMAEGLSVMQLTQLDKAIE